MAGRKALTASNANPPNSSSPSSSSVTIRQLPPSALLGIDLIAFSLRAPNAQDETPSPPPKPSPRAQTIFNLRPGPHFLYVSAMASHSLRTGVWIMVPTPDVGSYAQRWIWDAAEEQLRPDPKRAEPDAAEGVALDYEKLLKATAAAAATPEPDGLSAVLSGRPDELPRDQRAAPAADWPLLVSHVGPRVLTGLFESTVQAANGIDRWRATSAASGPQDREVIPGLEGTDYGLEHGEELRFLGIDLKRTWKEGAVGAERTQDARDRTGALERLVESLGQANGTEDHRGGHDLWGRDVLGEMQICFILVLTLANYSCLEEWKRILGLVLTCREAVSRREAFFEEFFRVLKLQLVHCDDVEGGLFEIADAGGGNYLKGLLRGFRRILDEDLEGRKTKKVAAAMKGLEEWLADAWGWELGDSFVRRGMLQLEDGEDVEVEMDDMQGEDERGEYAPVVVEL